MAQENLKPLKTLVISMGVVLLGGTIFLGMVVMQKILGGGASAHSASPHCAPAHIDLKNHGALQSSALNGQSLQLVFKKPHQLEIITLDSCSGQQLNSMTIDTGE